MFEDIQLDANEQFGQDAKSFDNLQYAPPADLYWHPEGSYTQTPQRRSVEVKPFQVIRDNRL